MSLPREHQNALAWDTLESTHQSGPASVALSYSHPSCAHVICLGVSLEKAEPKFWTARIIQDKIQTSPQCFLPFQILPGAACLVSDQE